MGTQRAASKTVMILKARPITCLYPKASSHLPIASTARRRLHTSNVRRQAAFAAVGAPDVYPTSHEQIPSPGNTQNFINNHFVESKTSSWIDLHDPATNNLVTRVPQCTDEELNAAVVSAQAAFPAWKATSLLHKQQVMFKFVGLIRQHWDRLAASITLEQGKTYADAKGDVLRGLQVAETACGITTQLTGEVLEVAKDMETRNYREPLGVVAAICPFSEYCSTDYYLWGMYRINMLCRFSSYDTPMVNSNCYNHRKHPDLEAI